MKDVARDIYRAVHSIPSHLFNSKQGTCRAPVIAFQSMHAPLSGG